MPFDVAGLVVKVSPEGIKATADELKDFTREAGRAEKAADGLTGSGKAAEDAMYEFGARAEHVASRPLSLLKGALIALPFLVVGKQALDLGVSIVKTGAQFEVLAKQIQAVMGSESEAARALDWIDEFTLKTPLQVEEVAMAFNQLKAIGLDPMSGSLQAIVDATSFTAQGFEGLIGVTRQLGQAWSAERLQGEEIRTLQERMIPVYDLLGEKMGKTAAELRKMASAGELGRREITLLLEAMGERYAGAAALQMETLEGQISNLQQAITFAFREISEGGLLDAVKVAVADIADSINRMIESGRLTEIGASLGELVSSVAEYAPDVLNLFEKLVNWIPEIVDHADEAAKAIIGIFVIDKATDFLRVLERFGPAFKGATSAAWGLHAAVAAIVGVALAEWFDSWHRQLEGPTALAIANFQQAVVDAGMNVEGLLASFPEAADRTEAWRMAFQRFMIDTKQASQAIGQWTPVVALFNAASGKATKGVGEFTVAVTETEKAVKNTSEEIVKHADLLAMIDEQFSEAERAATNMRISLMEASDTTGQFQTVLFRTVPELDNMGRNVTDLGMSTEFTLVPALESATSWFILEANAVEQLRPKLTATQRAVEEFSNEFKQSIVELFTGGFRALMEGEFESFEEIFVDFAQRMAETIISTFIDRIIANKGNVLDAFTDVFGTGEGDGGGMFPRAMGIIGGAGMVYSGFQQGGAAGALSGAMGGAMIGSMIAPGIGTIVGAVLGGLAGLFGGGGDDPARVSFRYGAETGFRVYGSGGPIQFGDEARRTWERNMNLLVDQTQAAYRDLLRLFEMPELFDLVGAIQNVDFGEMHLAPQDIARWIEDVWLPDQMDQMFGEAIRRGLENYSMSLESIQALFRELGDLPGAERLDALTALVSTLQQATELLETSFEDLRAEVEMGSIELFVRSLDEAYDAILLLQTGWESMSLLERADDLQMIGNIFEQVTQNTIQMLRQIEQISFTLNQSFDRMRESLELEGLTPQEIAFHAMQQIDDLMAQLAEAGSPEAVARISAEIQRYLQMVQASGVNLETTFGIVDPQTYREYIFARLDEAQALANERLQAMEDMIRERYERTQEAFELATAGVLEFADALDDVPWPGGGGPPRDEWDPWEPEDGRGRSIIETMSGSLQDIAENIAAAASNPPQVIVEISGDIGWLEPYIRTVITNYQLEQAREAGIG